MSEQFNAKTIASRLTTAWLGRSLHMLDSIDSTNTWLQARVNADIAAGTVVVTNYQQQGRGRLGRHWEAPPGSSLLFSSLFRPEWPGQRAAWLTMIAGVACVRAVADVTDLAMRLKWPNDLMLQLDGTWHKSGGILLESAIAGDRIQHAIVGIGLNVNIEAGALPATLPPATSLLLASGKRQSRTELLASILQHMETLYSAAATGTSPHAAWETYLLTRQQPVTVRVGTQTLHGFAENTDGYGRLRVRDRKGALHIIAAGDVTLRESETEPSDGTEDSST